MAVTAFASNNALTKKLWSEKLYRDIKKSLFLSNMIGKGSENIIELKDDFKKDKGDKVTFGIRMRITDRGQSSSTTGITLEGNEVALSTYDFSVELEEKGQAVRAQSKLTLQRTAFDLRNEMKSALADWGSEELEVYMLEKLLASPSTNRYIDATGTGDTMTLDTLRGARRKAVTASPTIRPVNVDGKKYYVALMHPLAIKGLLADDDIVNINTNARERGTDNPLVKGADYIVDGILIYEYNRAELLSTGNVATSLLLGAQAGALAWAQEPEWMEKDFDYGRIPGVAVDMIVGFGKTKFNSEDYGVIAIDSTYTADA